MDAFFGINTMTKSCVFTLTALLALPGCARLKNDVTGVSLVAGDGALYLGDYSRGLWHDKCEVNHQPPEERNGWGFKLDLTFGHTVRPLGYWWAPGFWKRDPIKIGDVPEAEWDRVFGQDLAESISKLPPRCQKYSIYNPWYAKHWLVLRIPKCVPSLFFSVSTPWRSFYLGSKSYRVDARTDTTPYPGRDSTWTNTRDAKRCQRQLPHDAYYALCPSISMRRKRD